MKTGRRIYNFRTNAGLTQEELAEKLFVSQQLVSRWENGTRRPDYKTLIKLADIFSVKVEEILPPDEIILSELSVCLPQKADTDIDTLTCHINGFLPLISEKERFIFLRRYYFSDEYSRISEMTGIRENQIRTILSRTRAKLKNYLKEVTL